MMKLQFTEAEKKYIQEQMKLQGANSAASILQEALYMHRIYTEKGILELVSVLSSTTNNKQSKQKKITYRGWSALTEASILKSYYTIIEKYGRIPKEEVLQSVALQNTHHSIWKRKVDYLTPEEKQNISYTFVWFAAKYLGIEKKYPLLIVKQVLLYFEDPEASQKINQKKIAIPIKLQVLIHQEVSSFINEYNLGQLLPNRIYKERKTAECLAKIGVKQYQENKYPKKNKQGLQIIVSLTEITRYVDLKIEEIQKHIYTLRSCGFIKEIHVKKNFKIHFVLHPNLFVSYREKQT